MRVGLASGMHHRSYIILLLPVLLLAIGCVTQPVAPQDPPSDSQVLNAWFEDLDRENFELHDTLLKALFVSRQTGKVAFVRRLEPEGAEEPQRLYFVSLERGGSDNIVGVNHATREFLFDHFLPIDCPTLNQSRERLRYAARIYSLKKDLGIFGIR